MAHQYPWMGKYEPTESAVQTMPRDKLIRLKGLITQLCHLEMTANGMSRMGFKKVDEGMSWEQMAKDCQTDLDNMVDIGLIQKVKAKPKVKPAKLLVVEAVKKEETV